MSNWLHISPTSGRGSTQMTISADTNTTGQSRKAKIIITAGTMTRTIEVVQGIREGDIVCEYIQTQDGVKLFNSLNSDQHIGMIVIESTAGTMTITGSAMYDSSLSEKTVYSFNGVIPDRLKVHIYFDDDCDGKLRRNQFNRSEELVKFSIYGKIRTLMINSLPCYCPRLESIYLYDGVIHHEDLLETREDAYSVCRTNPRLAEFTGDSPLIYNSRTLADYNWIIAFAPYGLEEYSIPNSITGVAGDVFNFNFGGSPDSAVTITPLTIRTVHIPNSVVKMCDYGFRAFYSLTGMTIPDSVVSAYTTSMFRDCTSLTQVNIGSGISILDLMMFRNCYSLTSLTIPATVTAIGESAFSGCTGLTTMTAENPESSAVTISYVSFRGIATGGTLYHPEGTDYSSWLSNDQYYLGYYLWNDGTNFNLLNVSTYILQFSSGATGTSNAQSVFINATRGDYQFNVSDNQSQTASTQTDWLVVSGTPSAGNVEFKIYPSTTASTQRFAYIHIVEGGRIWATITVEQSPVIDIPFQLENVSTYFLQFASGQTGSSNYQSVFINATRGDYQFNVSDNQSQTASTQSDWVVVSGTPAAGNVEFKIYPSTTAQTQRNCYIHIVEGGQIWATITVEQLPVNDVSFQLENVSTYYLQFSSGQTGSSNYQSVFVTANKADYQINISDNQTTTASTQTSWLTFSGTPASGYTEFKVFPTSTASTQRNCYIHIVEGGQIWATITVIQLDSIPSSVLNVSPTNLIFSGTANDSYSAQTLTVQSTVPYTFSQGADWFTVSGTPNVGNTTLKVYPISNNWNNARNSYIQFFYEGGYKNVSIEQKKANKPRIYTADTYFMATIQGNINCDGGVWVIIPAAGGGHSYYFTTNQSWISVSYLTEGLASSFNFSGVSSTDYAVLYKYVAEDNDTGANRSATISFFYDGELITSKTVTQRAFGFRTNLCQGACDYVVTVDANVTSYTFTVTSTTSFYCLRNDNITGSFTATCDGHIVTNSTSISTNFSVGTHTITVSFPTGVDGEGRRIGFLQFAQNKADFTGSTWNWYQIAFNQLGNLNTGKYLSATTTTITASSAAQTVSVPGFACNTLWGVTTSYHDWWDGVYGYNGFNITFEENTTGQQRSDTYTVEAEPLCDDGTGWVTPTTLTITITQNA